MSNVDDIVDLQNFISDVAPTRPSFGIPLLIGYHTRWVDVSHRLYASAADMLTDGFTTDDALYQAALKMTSQQPSVTQFMIGRRLAALTQTIQIVVTNATVGFKYSWTAAGTADSYTVQGGDTLTTIATAIKNKLDALTRIAATSSVATITATAATPGDTVDYYFGTSALSGVTITDTTADTTTDDTLAAVDAELDGQEISWYGVSVVDSSSKATALLVAAYVESLKKIAVLKSTDSGNYDSVSTTDTMYALNAATYTRTGVFYHAWIGGTEWLAAAQLGLHLPIDPGAETWAFKTAAGITFDVLNAAQKAAIDAKNGNIYVRSHGTNITWEGKAASGRFFDSTRFIDWQDSQIDFNVFGKLAGVPKQPFTNAGLSAVGLTIEQSLQQGVVAGGIDGTDTPPTVTVPKLSDTNAADRAARVAKTFKYTYRLSGALHSVVVRGTITV